jgi:hypothetical protein
MGRVKFVLLFLVLLPVFGMAESAQDSWDILKGWWEGELMQEWAESGVNSALMVPIADRWGCPEGTRFRPRAGERTKCTISPFFEIKRGIPI